MRRIATALLVIGIGAGCSPDRPPEKSAPPSGWSEVGETGLNATQVGQRDSALAARDALFLRLMARLTEVVSKDGPSAAISVCQSEAPAIAEAVGREKNVRIGRTALKLRNPNNRPPDWASSAVSVRPEAPTYFAGPEGRFGALLPIRLKAQCLTCHGKPETIAEPVRLALKERYPADQAVGFAEGDLRGWFWVEVPSDR